LTDRGLETTLADNLSFDTEEQMKTTLDGLKPRTFESIEDVMKDGDLSKIVRTYGDKRQSDLQSKIDKDRSDKKDDDKDDKDKDKPAEKEPEYIKKMNERLDKLDQQAATETFDKLVNFMSCP